MPDKFFYDTNIFIYLGLTPKTEENIKKHEIVKKLFVLHQGKIFISSQVLNEVSNVLLRKSSLEKTEIFDFLNLIINICNVIHLTPQITITALDLHFRYQFSFYDCLIVSAAFTSDCEYLVTEDLQDGQTITYKSRRVKVINPFKKNGND